MPSEIKSILRRLNLDDSYYNLGKDDYVDALNITKDAQEASNDMAVTNIIGNRLVPYNKPAGTNVTIGAKADTLRNRVFEFIWNSNDYHSIVILDLTTRIRTKLIENLTDTNQIDVLQFSRYNKIIHVDIIYRDTEEGDLLFWTDGVVSPRKCNIKHIQDGNYTYIKVPFIELAKQPPRTPIQSVYGSDSARNANSLRKKLVMPTYRFVYDDYEKSTCTTYGKIPLPIGYYGSDNDIDNTKNNFITFTVETGDENVTDIEILVRFNIGGNWQDFILAISLNKAQLNIPSNSTYDYLFYNDAIYPVVDVQEATQLFDWCPKKAKSQCLPNGNVVVLSAITENYDNYPISELDVTITAENVSNVPPDADPPSITYEQSGSVFVFTVHGNPIPEGSRFQIYIFFNGNPGIGQTYGVRLVADYTSIAGDTKDDVAYALSQQFNSYSSVPSIGVSYATNYWQASGFVSGAYVQQVIVTQGTPSSSTISSEKVWMWDANYIYGLAYKDDQGRIMPGVTTYVNPINSDNDFLVTTPSFSLDASNNVQTPVVNAAINHLPPEGAVTYGWVRRRMTYANFLYYETCDFQEDTDFYYLCLANIEQYKEDNSQFNYGTAPITSESRIKIVAGITSGAYNGDLWSQDYEILGQVTRTLTGGSSPDDDRFFIKIKKPDTAPSPTYYTNMLVMVYTPMANPTDEANSVYWEWSEEYAIYTLYTISYSSRIGAFTAGETITGGTSGATGTVILDDGAGTLYVDSVIREFQNGETITGGTSGATAILDSFVSQAYHRGKEQDQDASQPATFRWIEGDVYFHQRSMYPGLIATPPLGMDTLFLMDANYSDFFVSSVNDNGRGLTIEPNARETYFPATMRFSREYQQNTSINQTNRFFYENFMDLDRSFGSILKTVVKDRYIKIGQQFKLGVVPIFNQISRDSAGNQLLASTDTLLNPVQYYLGDYGVGDTPECWVDFNNSSYFFYSYRGIWGRLSLDGITPISILYKINSWASQHGVLRGGNYKIYGAFDSKANNCIFAFEATNTDSAYTLSFNEPNNAYESFLSYHPEMMVTVGSLLITYKNGDSWTHDSELYNNFYGVQYPSTITPVFNENPQIKKKYLSVAYQSNKIWSSPDKGDVKTSTVNSQTNLQQESKILESNYELQETLLTAALNYDMNSRSDERLALWEGDYLSGNYCVIKFLCPEHSSKELINFNIPYINYIRSPRNF